MSNFTHLHVASGYSLRYGASTPQALVEVAAAQGMEALALTDRDGLYGAVKFVLACRRAAIAPLLGVDLAVEGSGVLDGLVQWADRQSPARRSPTARRLPVRGGADTDPLHPRVTVLALGSGTESGTTPGQGWAHLCRLISATHLRGERGRPVSSAGLIAAHATVPAEPAGSAVPTGSVVSPDAGERVVTSATAASARRGCLVVLLGPSSEVGRALSARRPDLAGALLDRWRAALPPGSVHLEVVCHDGPPLTPTGLAQAGRTLELARRSGVPAVLTNAVRHATPDQAVTVDVLDAARRLVPLDDRHLDQVNAAAHLAGPMQMAALAERIARSVVTDPVQARAEAERLLADTEALALRCRLDPAADIGLGAVHLPEPEILGLGPGLSPAHELRARCEAGVNRRYPHASAPALRDVLDRMDAELRTIGVLGYESYFLTVAIVCDLIRDLGVRVAARGSGAGSLVNHLLGISGVDPLRHDLVMERFLSPLRAQLPDIDVDVESARRTEVYEAILGRFGADRVACVSMMDTYRVRHAVRDAGAALGLPLGEIDTIAKSFPHIRARDVRRAIADLPELRGAGLSSSRLDLLFDLVERLDGLPRHVALHPCGVLVSDAGLLGRTPVEASWTGFPMSQFDKEDVEELGLLKLDILGIRMQSAMAYALDEIARTDGPDTATAGGHPPEASYLDPTTGRIDLDAVPHDDEATFRLIRTTRTLGCFQIESPGQRELVGKFAPETFADLIVDISLFRPGPVKSDMVTPFLRARQGWEPPHYVHSALTEILAPTCGVVVFHEQVLQLVAVTAGCDLAEADEVRRAMGSTAGQAEVEAWWRPRTLARGFDADTTRRIWEVLTAFASFGFCKAHAAAFALPTYQSAWLKAHHPAAFLAGVLTHDPGMYPKRLILDDARNLGIVVLPLDVNASDVGYRVERIPPDHEPCGPRPHPDLPDGRGYGIRPALTEVKGISDAEVARIIAGRPYHDLADLWHRAGPSRPVAERLVLTGALDSIHGLDSPVPLPRRDRLTRRDLLLQVADLDRWSRAKRRLARRRAGRPRTAAATVATPGGSAGQCLSTLAPAVGGDIPGPRSLPHLIRAAAAAQSQAPAVPAPVPGVQLVLDALEVSTGLRSGLPEMTDAERVKAEIDVLGLDVTRHVLDFYTPLLEVLGITRAKDLPGCRSRSEILVAGVKVATQTPAIRSGRRVVFLTLDDSTGPVDATFFEDVQGPYAATVFHSWLLVVRGVVRRTGPRGISLRATGAWELPLLWDAWTDAGDSGVRQVLGLAEGDAVPGDVVGAGQAGDPGGGGEAHGRRVLVHVSGFRQSPYADVRPAGEDARDTRRMTARGRDRGPDRKLWHASPGSSGR